MIGGSRVLGGFICPGCHLRLPRHVSTSIASIVGRNASKSLQRNLTGKTCNKASSKDSETTASSEVSSVRKVSVADKESGNLLLRTENLAAGILGRPAKAIVVKRRDLKSRKPPPTVHDVAKESTAVEAIWDAALGDETSGVSPDEIQTNVDALRPNDIIITEREFEAIARTLLLGFTAAQLAKYINASGTGTRKPVCLSGAATRRDGGPNGHSEGVGIGEQPWIVQRFPWIPGRPANIGHTASMVQGDIPRATGPKDVLVERLMREYWGLSTRERMDGPGQLEVKVRDPWLSLLLAGEKRWLREISRVHLERVGGRMDLSLSDGMLRIQAPKATAETILADIDEVLRATVTSAFELRLVTGEEDISADVLHNLGRLTNSHVRLSGKKGHKRVVVSWIDVLKRDNPQQVKTSRVSSRLEDTRDIVFRLLLTMDEHRSNSSSLTLVADLSHPGHATSRGRLVKETITAQELPWPNRLDTWARWVTPSTNRMSNTLPPSLSPSKIGDMFGSLRSIGWPNWPLEPLVRQRERPTPFATPSKESWPAIKISSTAIFGRILHSLPTGPGADSATVTLPAPPPTATSSLHRRRVLCPITPPVLSGHFTDQGSGDSFTNHVLIRLLPSPFGHGSGTAPALDLRLRVWDGRVSGISSLVAIHGSHKLDILLPDQAVDVQLVQRRISEMPGRVVASTPGMAPVLEFLSAAHLSPADGVFKTPSLVAGVELPSSFLPDSEPLSTGAQGSNSSDVTKRDYLFGGLEVRRSATTGFEGWSMVHTSVEGGQVGGQWAELSLQADFWEKYPENGLLGGVESVSTHFMGTVMAIATGHHFKWVL